MLSELSPKATASQLPPHKAAASRRLEGGGTEEAITGATPRLLFPPMRTYQAIRAPLLFQIKRMQ